MKFCRLLKKRRIVLLTVIGMCLLGGCGSNKAVEADDDIASAAVTDVITVSETVEETIPETENDTSSETVEETIPETENVTSSETTEETIPETENDTSSETVEETIPETENDTSSETTEEAVTETEIVTSPETTAENAHTITYVLNTNTKRIHYTDCGSVKKIKPENYDTTDDFDKAISDGFKPCGNCKPHG